MKAVFATLLISVAFLLGSSLHAITIAEPAPEIVTEYIFLSPNTITFGPQQLAKRAYTYGVDSATTPTAQTLTPALERAEVEEVEQEVRYYDTESLINLFGSTPWPVHLWPSLIRLIACEATTPEGVDARAIGDEELMPVTGPSYGLTQINVSAHPQYARSYDLLDGHQNLLAAYGIYAESGYSFAPWSCAE